MKNKIQHFQALLILGIKSGASDRVLKSAYRKLAKIHHPDKGGTKEEFVILKQAYDLLVEQGTTEPVKQKQGFSHLSGFSDPFAGISITVTYVRVA